MFMNIPPQDEVWEFDDPSELHLIQVEIGGCQMTSVILGAFAGVQVDIKFLQYQKFRDATTFVLLPNTDVLEIILDIELLKYICLLLKRLNKAAVIITLH